MQGKWRCKQHGPIKLNRCQPAEYATKRILIQVLCRVLKDAIWIMDLFKFSYRVSELLPCCLGPGS